MRFGVCAGLEAAGVFRDAGYRFLELNVQRDLMPDAPAGAFEPQAERIRSSELPCEAANCFLPADCRLTGPDVDEAGLRRYAATALERAATVGIRTVVFGSGGARRIPDGFSRERAGAQLRSFGAWLGERAGEQGVTVVVEPLNRLECNVLNTLAESAAYVRAVGSPNLQLLADAFHWSREAESADAVVQAGPLLRHVHIATYSARRAPGAEPCDFEPFFAALREGGYDGRVSIEGRWEDPRREAAAALDAMRPAGRPGRAAHAPPPGAGEPQRGTR